MSKLLRFLTHLVDWMHSPRMSSEEYEIKYIDRKVIQHRFGNIIG